MRTTTSKPSGTCIGSQWSWTSSSRLAVAAAFAVAFVFAPPAGAAGFPVFGSGDIHFRLDHASFRSGAGSTESEFYIEIDNNELTFRKEGESHRAKIELRLEFYDSGRRLVEKTYEPDFWEQDAASITSPAHTQVLQLRVPSPAESDSVHARVEDQNARKRGLFHMFTGSRRAGEAGAALGLRRFPAAELSVSDLEFARSVRRPGGEPTFVKPSGLEVEPHPGRVYGGAHRVGMVYLEVYDLAATGEARRYELDYAIRDADGAEVRSWVHALRSQNSTWVDTTSFDLGGLRADTYSLGVVVKEEAGGGRAAVEAAFDVVWSVNWVRWLMDTETMVLFLPLGKDIDRFLTMRPGAKERYLEAFWSTRDPTPGPGNATREEFDRRLQYANSDFSTSLEPGMRTDRGRVYIKYGEPDDIRREVIPVQGNDINAALEELDRGTGGDLRGSRNIDPEDSRAFEVWVYDYRGEELFPAPGMSSGLGRQFVFVDDLGVGDFRLIRSSEKSEF